MRAKHLLMTTALTALLASCSNEDFLDNAQLKPNGDAAARPTVDNVILNLVEGNEATTRLGFNGGYQWQANDTIGALLIDKLNTTKRPSTSTASDPWHKLPWTTRYQLVDYINTDYPFIRQNDGSWTTNAKMLEGNYIFTFPYASYSGNREAVHSIEKQVQDGISTNSIKEAYAKNQFFVGYSRIHAGTVGGDVMSTDLQMTPVLGAVGITVKNVGTEPFTVKKIVLTSTAFSTVIKVNPTAAEYTGANGTADYNLAYQAPQPDWDNDVKYFNYANYEEMYFANGKWNYNEKFTEAFDGGALVNNTEKSQNYNREEALRAVIEKIGDDNRAQLVVNNAPAIKTTESQNFIIMTNEYKYASDGSNKITAVIYTDRGMMKEVVISNVKSEVAGNGVTVISDNPIVEIAPSKANQVTLQLDNNSLQAPNVMDIYNESDLKQFIEWNKSTSRPYEATLKNDITLTKEMTDMLVAKEWNRASLIIKTSTFKLAIAKDAASNILDKILVNGNVEVLNDMVIGSQSYVSGKYEIYAKVQTIEPVITVAEGASLTVDSEIAKGTEEKALNVTNEGTFAINADVEALEVVNNAVMTIAAEVTIAETSTNNEDAVLTVGEGGTLRCAGKLTNAGNSTLEKYAVINNNGTIYNLVNGAWGKVIVGANDKALTNINSNAATGIIDITANINTNLNKKEGIIAYTLTGSKSMKEIEAAKITELTIDGGKVTSSATTAAKNTAAENIIVTTKGGSIIGTSTSSDSFAAAMEVNGDLALKNITLGGDIEIKAGTTSITGTVDAKDKDITLGSYDAINFKGMTATLKVVASGDELTVDEIKKSTDAKVTKDMAKVDNQGIINATSATKPTDVSWGGNDPKEIAAPAPKPTTVTFDVVFAGSGGTASTNAPTDKGTYTVTTLKELYDFMEQVESAPDWADNTKYEIGTITISSDLALSAGTDASAEDDHYTYLKTYAAGKEVKLGANLTDLTNAMNMSFGKLTVTAAAIVSSTSTNVVTLTVDNLAYDAALTITSGYIKITGDGQIGTGSTKVTGTGSVVGTSTGKIVTSKTGELGTLIKWNSTNKVWEAI